ncbi:MAG: FAD binding domain-containing protein [bacterium]
MVTLQRFIYPETLEEALSALAAGREKARPIAGGTSLIFKKGRGTETLVDITRLGLDTISVDEPGLVLGACARLQRLGDSPLVAVPSLRALGEAASRAGPRGVRNAITVGGNLAGYKRWSDTPIALMALGGSAHIAGPQPRQLRVSELLREHPLSQLEPGELITRILVPGPQPDVGSAFVKVSRTAIDYALVSAAARIALDEYGRCADVTLALGSVCHLPTDATPLTGELQGVEPSEELLNRVADRITEEIQPGQDMRASREYLARLAGVTARDALATALRRARGQDHG